MGHESSNSSKSRRSFLSAFTGQAEKNTTPGKVKMLTADGKIVEVDQAVLDAASKKQKATNQEIYDWMNNPSKPNNI
ncbi:MAG: hypothetical protein JST86_17855 [Bacteroidetes bacterium]|nr:hypothetical protein [Bacteroidota bacterium]